MGEAKRYFLNSLPHWSPWIPQWGLLILEQDHMKLARSLNNKGVNTLGTLWDTCAWKSVEQIVLEFNLNFREDLLISKLMDKL